ncbi:MAG: molybdopterin-dependent oxidoreductase [Gemmatimonadales bacterium]|nr:molybdopterin-dependent oxidoreductase [Gemmatimonadales bacterium]
MADSSAGRHAFTRRDFVRLGLVAAPAAVVAGCGWDGGSALRPALATISRGNDWVGEKILLADTRLARQYPPSERSRMMPNYHIADETPTIADPAAWALMVGGLVRKPVRLTLPMLQGMPRVTYTVAHHCVEGWTTVATWTGVPVRAVAALVEPTADAAYLRFDSFDRNPQGISYYNGWDVRSAMHPETILAYAFNDRPLMPDHGAPVRLYSPVKLGYKLTKYLTAMTFTRERPGGFWEDQGYPWLGGV